MKLNLFIASLVIAFSTTNFASAQEEMIFLTLDQPSQQNPNCSAPQITPESSSSTQADDETFLTNVSCSEIANITVLEI